MKDTKTKTGQVVKNILPNCFELASGFEETMMFRDLRNFLD